MTVYLAGIAVNLTVAGVAVLARAAAGPETRAGGLFAALILIALISVPTQFLLFMRTDLYFVLQDLARCGNLYADGGAYVRYLARRGAHAITGGGPAPADPSAALRPRERRTVRTYAPLLAIGTLICLGFAAAVTLPTGLTVLTRCARGLVTGDAEARVDAVVVAGIAITFWTIWTRAWWDRHGPRVTGWVTRRRTARR